MKTILHLQPLARSVNWVYDIIPTGGGWRIEWRNSCDEAVGRRCVPRFIWLPRQSVLHPAGEEMGGTYNENGREAEVPGINDRIREIDIKW